MAIHIDLADSRERPLVHVSIAAPRPEAEYHLLPSGLATLTNRQQLASGRPPGCDWHADTASGMIVSAPALTGSGAMIAVMGATGHGGAAVADELLVRGENVTVVTRHPERANSWSDQGASVALAAAEEAVAEGGVPADRPRVPAKLPSQPERRHRHNLSCSPPQL